MVVERSLENVLSSEFSSVQLFVELVVKLAVDVSGRCTIIYCGEWGCGIRLTGLVRGSYSRMNPHFQK